MRNYFNSKFQQDTNKIRRANRDKAKRKQARDAIQKQYELEQREHQTQLQKISTELILKLPVMLRKENE